MGGSVDDAGLVLTRAQMREVDRCAIEVLGVPSMVLMENAASGCAAVVAELVRASAGRVAIVCGTGNNGGDGLAMVRLLDERGVRAAAMVTGEPLTADARMSLEICRRCGLEVRVAAGGLVQEFRSLAAEAEIVVDAVFGTGLSRDVGGEVAELIGAINAWRAESGSRRVVAVDLPSGLDGDTGCVLGACVRADVTVTLAALKPGVTIGREWCGVVRVVGIGVPRRLLVEVRDGS